MDLNLVWFLLIGVLIGGYAVLDGFDLGIGSLYFLLGKNNEEKSLLMNAIGPFWDGNEVWLLTGAGAIFAAFPLVYSTVFSGFYLAMMLVLVGLIIRAVALEYRNRFDDTRWRKRLDVLFSLGSFIPALLFGVAMGNIARGLPLDSSFYYTGTFWGLLNPFALLFGLLGLSAFLLQGLNYTLLKTSGTVQSRAMKLYKPVWLISLLLFITATVYSLYAAPHLFLNYQDTAWLWIFPAFIVIGLLLTRLAYGAKLYKLSLLSSSLFIIGLISTLGMGMFPNLVPAQNPLYSLSIYNAASSPLTLKAMLIIALLGVPIVLFYTVYVYSVFRGKVDWGHEGY